MREYITGGLVGAWTTVTLPTVFLGTYDDIQKHALLIAALTSLVMLDILPRIARDTPKVPVDAISLFGGAFLGLLVLSQTEDEVGRGYEGRGFVSVAQSMKV